ncbi:GNAT family N-acetyltransferase [Dactylosporangium sp. NPDC050688]|uniref:GNAT family N-acetyltransferase n=1 Tax=Dactylosporangium sp. NPDC050688 TaxID=3157217 RepID=UPI0033EBEB1E
MTAVPAPGHWQTRALTGDEWQLKRRLRLAALLDSPAVFASSHAREAGRSETQWRDWPPHGSSFAVFDGAEPVGIACGWTTPAQPGVTHLISMWVCPAARGRGAAGRLVDAVAGWARQRGSCRVELEVAAGNDAAMRTYVRAGFTATGRKPFTAGGTVLELHLT